MSRQQIRATQRKLHCLSDPREWLAGLVGAVEVKELELIREGGWNSEAARLFAEGHVESELRYGAARRERKEDYGSMEQMLFAADLLHTYGVRGLKF